MFSAAGPRRIPEPTKTIAGDSGVEDSRREPNAHAAVAPATARPVQAHCSCSGPPDPPAVTLGRFRLNAPMTSFYRVGKGALPGPDEDTPGGPGQASERRGTVTRTAHLCGPTHHAAAEMEATNPQEFWSPHGHPAPAVRARCRSRGERG